MIRQSSYIGFVIGVILTSFAACAETNTKDETVSANTIFIPEDICQKSVAKQQAVERNIISQGELAIPGMISALSSKDKYKSILCKKLLIRLLGKIGAKSAVPILLEYIDQGGDIGAISLLSLGMIDCKKTREKIANMTFEDNKMMEAHAQVLANCNHIEALQKLFGYLSNSKGVISTRARQSLCNHLSSELTNEKQPFFDLLNNLSDKEDDELTPKICKNIVLVASAIPDLKAQQTLISDFLYSESGKLRHETLKAVIRNPNMLSAGNLQETLGYAIQNEACHETIRKFFMELGTKREFIPICQVGLNHQTRSVQLTAADALGRITGQKFGRNILAWQNWLAQQSNGNPISITLPSKW